MTINRCRRSVKNDARAVAGLRARGPAGAWGLSSPSSYPPLGCTAITAPPDPDSERWRTIVESAADAILTFDASGAVEAVNPAGESLWGHPAADLIGRDVAMLFPEPDRVLHEARLSAYREHGERSVLGVTREVAGLRADGTTFTMQFRVTDAVIDGAVRLTMIARDVSDLRGAEQDRARRGDFASTILAALQDGLVVRRLDGSIAQVNQRFCEMTGFSEQELVDSRPPFPYWPADGPGASDLDVGEGGEADLVLRHRDGTPIPAIVTATAVHDAGGGMVMYVEMVKDVTGRRAAEQALASERDHVAGIVSALRDGLIVSSPEGSVLETNQPFLDMVGLDVSAVVGARAPYPWWDPEDPATQAAIAAVLAEGRGEFELMFRRASGEQFPVSISVASRRDSEGRNLGFVSTYRDMGSWHAAQDELRRRELAQRESDALLATERDARRLKDEFLAMVSHELRTPLSAVLGYLELALADISDPDLRDLLEVAERNGRRLASLVRDILLVSQAGAGRLGLDLRPVFLGDLVSQAVRAARPAAHAKEIALQEDVAANPSIAGDPDRLGQVLDNLISNAIKFSPPAGGVRVRLELGGDCARITVADDGPGIPADECDLLFEPFYRARQASHDVVPGSGLGLAVVKAIAEAHGGRVSVQSELGRGSVFLAEIPLDDEVAGPRLAAGVTR